MSGTDISVLIAHAKDEEFHAEKIRKHLLSHGITVVHHGTMLSRNSFTSEASAAVNTGCPIILCGSIRASGTGWARSLVRFANATGNVIYPIQMEKDADFSGLLPLNTKFFLYFSNPGRAVDELVQTLKQGHPHSFQILMMDEEKELADYCSWALKKHGNVALIGVGRADLTMDLAKIYVPLRISQSSLLVDIEQYRVCSTKGSDQQHDSKVELTDIFSITDEKQHVALFGDPGAGKSTAMRKLLHLCLVKGPNELNLEQEILPFFLRLRRFGAPFLTQPLSAFLQNELDVDSGHKFPSGLGEQLWKRGKLLLLFDGLDEIANQDLRAKVAAKLEKSLLNEQSRKIYAVISCRYAGYGGNVRLGDSFLHLDVHPLGDHQVDVFVRLWFQEAHRCLPKGDPLQAEREASTLLSKLSEPRYANQQIKILVGNPLLLTLLCVVVLQKQEIPRRRVEFYRQCLEVLLYRWRYLLEQDAPPLSLELALAVLRQTAWEMHSTGRQYDLTEQEFISLSGRVLDRQGASELLPDGGLHWFQVTCGVLEEYSPKCYGFMHLGFQEYLAACHVASQRQTLVANLVGRRKEKWWKEVILLLAGLEDSDLFVRLVESVMPDIRQAEGVEMLREVLFEAPVVDMTPFEGRLANGEPEEQSALLRLLQGRSNARLREIAEQLAEESNNQEVRILANHFLDRPTHDVIQMLATDIVLPSMSIIIEPSTGIRLLPVPGGTFTMGSNDGDHDERPPHPVQLSPYWLGETPVTNQQYGIYLRETQVKEPAYWRDRRFSDPQQPVVGVAWEEAMDFCDWLTQKVHQDHTFTLPSEAQWEFAARGMDGRHYPWGNEGASDKFANYKNHADNPMQVGNFPAGRGPFGHLDLAGNVCEWCQDGWSGNYKRWSEKTPLDPMVTEYGNGFVVRGGSWKDPSSVMRSAYRYGDSVNGRRSSIGFRVAAIGRKGTGSKVRF